MAKGAAMVPSLEFVTTLKGKPRAVVLDIDDWKRIAETLNIMSSKELRESINRAKAQLKKGVKLLSLKEVFENL